MNILVTGGAGFVGSHVAEYYATKGEDVAIVDNFSRNDVLKNRLGDPLYNLNYLKEYNNISIHRVDVRDFNRLKEVAKDVDVIIHCAAQVAVTSSLSDPSTDFNVNVVGTLNMLELARVEDSSFVFCSTNKVYGENVNKIPLVEKETRYEYADERYKLGIPEGFPVDLAGHSPYGCSKLSADLYVQEYAHTYGIKTCVFRMSCVYGERQLGVEDQGWVSWFAIATLTGRPITIYGDGKQVRDLLYVKDLVRAFDRFIKSNLDHAVFNLGGGPNNALSLLELISMLERFSGKKPNVKFSSWRPFDQKVYVSNVSRLRDVLGWEPLTSVEEGVKKLVKWISENVEMFKS